MIFEDMDRIVFAGDSVTDMGSAQPVGEGLFDNLGIGYVRIIDNMLSACYPEFNIRVTNSGISGNTSRDLLERFQRDVVDLKPDCQVLPDEYEQNVEKMILQVKDRVKGIFLLSPYYMEPNREDKMRSRMDEYVAICAKLAGKHNCIYVDFQQMYEDYCKIRHSSFIAWDRVHPNRTGATLMARAFLEKCDFDYLHFSNPCTQSERR